MADHDRLTVEEVLTAFDEHLRRPRGVCPGTRRNYAKYVGEFLGTMFGDGGVEFAEVRAPEVAAFVGGLSGRYQPRTVEHASSALRVFCQRRLKTDPGASGEFGGKGSSLKELRVSSRLPLAHFEAGGAG